MRKIIQQLNMVFGQHNNAEITKSVNKWYLHEFARNGVMFTLREVDEAILVMRLLECINGLGLSCESLCSHILPVPFVNHTGSFDVSIEFLPGAFYAIAHQHLKNARWGVVCQGDDFVYEGPTQPIHHVSAGAGGKVVSAYVECALKEGDVIVCMLEPEELAAGMGDLLSKKLCGLAVCDDIFRELAVSLVFQRMRDDALGSYLDATDADAYAAYYAHATFGLELYERQKADNKVYGSWGGVIAHKKRVFSAEDKVATKEKTKAVLKVIEGGRSGQVESGAKNIPNVQKPELSLVKENKAVTHPPMEVAQDWGVL